MSGVPPREVDPREARLPAWAQAKLSGLRRIADDLERRVTELAGDVADTDTISAPYDDHPQRLPRGRTVRFVTGPHSNWDYVDVMTGKGLVEVRSSRPLVIYSRASNVIHVALEPVRAPTS